MRYSSMTLSTKGLTDRWPAIAAVVVLMFTCCCCCFILYQRISREDRGEPSGLTQSLARVGLKRGQEQGDVESLPQNNVMPEEKGNTAVMPQSREPKI